VDNTHTRNLAEYYIADFRGTQVDKVIIGFNHNPQFRSVIRTVLDELLGPQVKIIDSATAVAVAVDDMLVGLNLRRSAGIGEQKFYVTDAPERVASVAGQFWSTERVAALALEHIDLLDHQ
jgi:glutamate racemase